jgi:Bacterial lectin
MYVGLTAATGGASSTQTIADFTVNGSLITSFNEVFLGNGKRIQRIYLPCECPGLCYGSTPYRLNDDFGGQTETLWATQTFSSSSFTASFSYYIEGSSNGDGFTICFAQNPILGEGGGGLGYSGFPTTVAVEVDSYQNPHDPDNSHIAILSAGNVANHLAISREADGTIIRPYGNVRVEYASGVMRVYHKKSTDTSHHLIITHNIDVPAIVGP